MGRQPSNIRPSDVKIPITVRFPLKYRNHLRKVAAENETTLTDLIVDATEAKYPVPTK